MDPLGPGRDDQQRAPLAEHHPDRARRHPLADRLALLGLGRAGSRRTGRTARGPWEALSGAG